MLVLTRRVGEDIVIDGHIRITIMQVNGGRVRVGFEAPPSVSIRRRELLQRAALRESSVAAATGQD